MFICNMSNTLKPEISIDKRRIERLSYVINPTNQGGIEVEETCVFGESDLLTVSSGGKNLKLRRKLTDKFTLKSLYVLILKNDQKDREIITKVIDKEEAEKKFERTCHGAAALAKTDQDPSFVVLALGDIEPDCKIKATLTYFGEMSFISANNWRFNFPIPVSARDIFSPNPAPLSDSPVIPQHCMVKVKGTNEILTVVDQNSSPEATMYDSRQGVIDEVEFPVIHEINLKVRFNQRSLPVALDQGLSSLFDQQTKVSVCKFADFVPGESELYGKPCVIVNQTITRRSTELDGPGKKYNIVVDTFKSSFSVVQNSLIEALTFLPDESVFNIMSFGNDNREYKTLSFEGDKTNADTWVRNLQSTPDRSDVDRALQEVFSRQMEDVILLVGSSVYNYDQILISASEHRRRMFVLGAGDHTVDLCEKLAQYSGCYKRIDASNYQQETQSLINEVRLRRLPAVNLSDFRVSLFDKNNQRIEPSLSTRFPESGFESDLFNSQSLASRNEEANEQNNITQGFILDQLPRDYFTVDTIIKLSNAEGTETDVLSSRKEVDYFDNSSSSALIYIKKVLDQRIQSIKKMTQGRPDYNACKESIIRLSKTTQFISPFTAFYGEGISLRKRQSPKHGDVRDVRQRRSEEYGEERPASQNDRYHYEYVAPPVVSHEMTYNILDIHSHGFDNSQSIGGANMVAGNGLPPRPHAQEPRERPAGKCSYQKNRENSILDDIVKQGRITGVIPKSDATNQLLTKLCNQKFNLTDPKEWEKLVAKILEHCKRESSEHSQTIIAVLFARVFGANLPAKNWNTYSQKCHKVLENRAKIDSVLLDELETVVRELSIRN